MKDNSKYLINEDPIFFLPSLAVGIGLNEAILLQKIHGWLQCAPKEHVGRNWIYNTYKSWHEQLPFMSEITIKRAIKNLIDKKIIITENFNKNNFDKTTWYSIDYKMLENVVKRLEIVENSDSIKMIPSIVSNCTYREYQNDTTNTNNNYNNKKEIYKEKYFDNDIVNGLFIEFLDMRKKLKVVNTDRAITLLINKLNKYDDDIKKQMLENAIERSWKSVYEIKGVETNKGVVYESI